MPCRQHNNEAFYAASPNYCRDTPASGMLHPGRRCYREVPSRVDYFDLRPGDQVCFDDFGNCEDSYDLASPVECRNADGTCNLSFAGSVGHFVVDMVPELAVFAAVCLVVYATGGGKRI